MSAEYTHRLCIAVPIALQSVANAIGRALDPDVGGARSFAGPTAGDPPTHAICDAVITAEFASRCTSMLTSAAVLWGAVAEEYADRWATFQPPALAGVERFLGDAKIAVEPRGRELRDLLAGFGLALSPVGDYV